MVKPLPVPKGARGPGELSAQILAHPPSRGHSGHSGSSESYLPDDNTETLPLAIQGLDHTPCPPTNGQPHVPWLYQPRQGRPRGPEQCVRRPASGCPLKKLPSCFKDFLLRIHLQCGRPGFNPWVGKIPWRRQSILAWRIPWTVYSTGSQRVGPD